MADEPLSSVYLTPVDPTPGAPLQMTTDPVPADIWDPDKSTEAGLAGSSTTYDFGQFANRCIRTLTWGGAGQWLDKDVVTALRQWLAVSGSTYRYQDGEGNDWTVEFIPPFRADKEFGQPRMYRVTLTLHVLAMDYLLGEVYAGQ